MKKTILAIAGSALIALSAVPFAAAAEHHHKAHYRAEFRDSNASVAPAYRPAAEPEWSRYSGGYSDMAGH